MDPDAPLDRAAEPGKPPASVRSAQPARPERSLPPGRPHEDAGIGELVAHLGDEAKHLVELQVEIAKSQAVKGAAAALLDAAKIGLAGSLLGLGSLLLIVAMLLGLGALFHAYWLGALITGGFVLTLGILFLWRVSGTLLLPRLLPFDLLQKVRDMARTNDPNED